MAQTRTALPVLEIKNPCPADWNAMAGDDRKRFCHGCQKHVHDLSAMTVDEAQSVLCSSVGELCVRFARTACGAPETLDYLPSRPRNRWPLLASLGAAACSCAAAAAVYFRPAAPRMIPCAPARVMVMGAMAPYPRPAPPTTQPLPKVITGEIAAPNCRPPQL